jgi:hypothetical protein
VQLFAIGEPFPSADAGTLKDALNGITRVLARGRLDGFYERTCSSPELATR